MSLVKNYQLLLKMVKMYVGLFVGQLWVAAPLRGNGYGTKLMQAAENLAKKSKCNFMAVYSLLMG